MENLMSTTESDFKYKLLKVLILYNKSYKIWRSKGLTVLNKE